MEGRGGRRVRDAWQSEVALCSAAAKFILSEPLNKIEGKNCRVHAQIPEAVHHFLFLFVIRASVAKFIFFWKVLRLLCVSNTLS